MNLEELFNMSAEEFAEAYYNKVNKDNRIQLMCKPAVIERMIELLVVENERLQRHICNQNDKIQKLEEEVKHHEMARRVEQPKNSDLV